MKFSVALFGHYKPRYAIRQNETGQVVAESYEQPGTSANKWVIGGQEYSQSTHFLYEYPGWEFREAPGDIIAYKPWSEGVDWTENEKKRYLIVVIDGIDADEMYVLTQPNRPLPRHYQSRQNQQFLRYKLQLSRLAF